MTSNDSKNNMSSSPPKPWQNQNNTSFVKNSKEHLNSNNFNLKSTDSKNLLDTTNSTTQLNNHNDLKTVSDSNGNGNINLPPDQTNTFQNPPPQQMQYNNPQMFDYGISNNAGLYGGGMLGNSYGYGGNSYYPSMGYGGMYGGLYNQPYSSNMNYYNNGPGGFMPYNNNMTFMSQMQMNTMPAFQLLERIVNTIGQFAQMLSSTYYATFSSFNAMVGVADQFSQLQNYMRYMFNIKALIRKVKRYLCALLGIKVRIDSKELSLDEYSKFKNSQNVSFKPLIMFFMVTFGLPYLLHRLLKKIYQQNQPRQNNIDPRSYLPNNMNMMPYANQQPPYNSNLDSNHQQIFPELQNNSNVIHPNNLTNPNIQNKLDNIEFAKVVYDYEPQQPNHDITNNEIQELKLRKDEVIAIINKTNTKNERNDWWTGRSKDGKVGIFPGNYVEIINKQNITTTNNNKPGK